MANFNINRAGFIIVGVFVVVWAIALLIWACRTGGRAGGGGGRRAVTTTPFHRAGPHVGTGGARGSWSAGARAGLSQVGARAEIRRRGPVGTPVADGQTLSIVPAVAGG